MRSDDYVEMSATCFIEAMSQLRSRMIGEQKLSDLSLTQQKLWHRYLILEGVVFDSQKFTFGSTHLFDDDDHFEATKSLASTSMEFFQNGVEIMPFPECWFEWEKPEGAIGRDPIKLKNSSKEACLVEKHGDAITFKMFFNENGTHRRELLNGWGSSGDVWVLKNYTSDVCAVDPTTDFLPKNSELYYDSEAKIASDHTMVYRALACMAILLSREAKIVEKRPPSGLIKHREKKGKVPLFSHKVVTIDPQRIVYDGGGQSSGIKRSSPRLHWRRGHVRTLGNGKKIGIPPCIIGAAENGILDKTYRVRPKPEDMHDPR